MYDPFDTLARSLDTSNNATLAADRRQLARLRDRLAADTPRGPRGASQERVDQAIARLDAMVEIIDFLLDHDERGDQ